MSKSERLRQWFSGRKGGGLALAFTLALILIVSLVFVFRPASAALLTVGPITFDGELTADVAEERAGAITDFGPVNNTTFFNSGLVDSNDSVGVLLGLGVAPPGRAAQLVPGIATGTSFGMIRVSWDNTYVIDDPAGDDFVIAESGNEFSPGYYVVRIKTVGEASPTGWYYKPAQAFRRVTGQPAGGPGEFFTAYDIDADFLRPGDTVEYIEIRNLLATDTVQTGGGGVGFLSGDPAQDDPAVSPVDQTPSGSPAIEAAEYDADIAYAFATSVDSLQSFVAIGDFVWQDNNGDGIQDVGEPGVENVTVNLLDGAGDPVLDSDGLPITTLTNATGFYSFTVAYETDYILEFVPPTGYDFTAANQGADDVDSDVTDLALGQTGVINIPAGTPDTDPTLDDYDAGLLPAIISDFVWNDLNGNGIQDGGEPGLEGVTVVLYDSGDTLIAPTTTDATGFYSFAVPAGDYYLVFDPSTVTPAPTVGTYIFSPQDAGTPNDDTLDSDPDPATGQTPTFTAPNIPGPAPFPDANTQWDAGLFEAVDLGDFVWEDANGDGIQDPGESGIPGVNVTLLDAGGTPVNPPITAVTDGNGNYTLFDVPVDPDYIIQFELPTGYEFTQPDQGTDDVDSDVIDPATGQTAVFDVPTLAAGAGLLSLDAGMLQPIVISNFVWEDADANGLQDTGENGVSGVTVNLYDSAGVVLINTTTTDATGIYTFTTDSGGLPLLADTYVLEFDLSTATNPDPPTALAFTQPDVGGGLNEDIDSDVTNIITPAAVGTDEVGRTDPFPVNPGETADYWDAGVFQAAVISDRVWNDVNGNGIQDGGEPNIDGVPVNLYDSTGTNLIATDTTAGGGLYEFLVPAGLYIVEFDLAGSPVPGYAFSPKDNPAATEATDSDVNPTTGRTDVVDAVAGVINADVDAGAFDPIVVTGYVWNDLNGDGTEDAGETTRLENVTVRLLDETGAPLAPPRTTTTDATGVYTFSVPADPGAGADYLVEFVAPAGYVFSAPGGATSDVIAPVTAGRTAAFDAPAGGSPYNLEAGLYQPSSIGDRVWRDSNGNGIQDTGEPGLANVTVNLLDDTGTPTGFSAVTNATGNYIIPDVPAGDYILEFTNLPANYVFTQQDAGTDDTIDSDPAAGAPPQQTAVFTLPENTADTSRDAGAFIPVTIGDFVWNDLNGNGIQNTGEPGLANVTVELYDTSDTLIDSTVTDGTGIYSFPDGAPYIPPGTYYIRFLQDGDATGFAFSPQDQGTGPGADTLDSDADPTTGETALFDVTSGANVVRWDAGLFNPSSITGVAWLDLNADGNQQLPEDAPVQGVTVILYNNAAPSTPIMTTTTDVDGIYTFMNVPDSPSNFYIVEFVTPLYSFSPNGSPVGDPTFENKVTSPTTGRTDPFTVVAGALAEDVDAGLLPAAIGDFVWNDLDGDGIQDSGEPGLEGVTVNLWRSNDTLHATTTTLADGSYIFSNVPAGDYYLEFDQTTSPVAGGYVFSPGNATTDDLDSDVVGPSPNPGAGPGTGIPGVTAVFTVDPAFNTNDLDAGLFNGATIGNFVWNDLNVNGIQEPLEPGIDGVTVRLIDALTLTTVQTTTTQDGGFYSFGVIGGNYIVEFELPTDFNFSPQDAGTDDALDSDPDPATGQTASFGVGGGTSNFDVDAGMWTTTSIGDFVWFDEDGNGIQGVSETGIQSVTVRLGIEDEDTGVRTLTGDTTTTDAAGFYEFTDIDPANYYVQFELPAGFGFSPPNVGSNDNIDSDADPNTGETPSRFMNSGSENDDLDAGMFEAVIIGDLVWFDANADGIQNESPLTGVVSVTVNLLDGSGNPLVPPRTTTTDANGNYSFAVLPGTYILEFVPSPQYIITLANQGTDDALDSDPDRDTGRTEAFTMSLADPVTTIWDAGVYQSASIGDLVWHDQNGDGLFQAGEPGLEGVLVFVDLNNNGVFNAGEPFDTTAADGSYTIFGLDTGTYTVTVATGIPAGFGLTTGNLPFVTTVTAGEAITDADFGYSASPDLVVTKSDGGVIPAAGDTLTYTLTISNVGLVNSTGIVITETLPISTSFNTTLNPPGWTAVITDQVYVFNVGSLVPGAGTVITLVVDIDPLLPASITAITNTAVVDDDGTNGVDANIADNTATLTTPVLGVVGPVVDLAIAKSDGRTEVQPGEILVYTVTVTNTTAATSSATGITVTDTLPAGVSFLDSADWVPDPNNPGTLVWNIPSLAPGQAVVSTYRVTVNSTTAPGTLLANNAQVTDDGTSGPDIDPGNNSAVDETLVGQPGANNFTLSKDDGGITVRPGDTIVYTLTYAYVGEVPASGVVITETLPTNTSFNATLSDPGWQAVGGDIYTLTLGDLASGANGTVVFAVTVNADIPLSDTGEATITNLALIGDDGLSGAPVISAGDTTPVVSGVTPPTAIEIYLPVIVKPLPAPPPSTPTPTPTATEGPTMTPTPTQGPVGQPNLVGTIRLNPDKRDFAAGEPVEIIVEVTNIGTAPAEEFWIDLFINPTQVPSPSIRWNDLCTSANVDPTPCFGMVWSTSEPLAPNESVTFTSTNVDTLRSNWNGWFARGTTDLYLLVDSWSGGSVPQPDNGAIDESNETDNLFHLSGLTVTGTNPATSADEVTDIPPR